MSTQVNNRSTTGYRKAPVSSSDARQIALAHLSTSPAPAQIKYLRKLLGECFSRLRNLIQRKNRRRKLQLLEMQQLGEKRFVAIVRVGKQKFLIGGAASSVSLLAEIGTGKTAVLAPRPLNKESA